MSIITEIIDGWFNNNESTSAWCSDWRTTGSKLKTKFGIRINDGRTRRVYASNNGQSMRLFIMLDGKRWLLVNPDYFNNAISLQGVNALLGKDIFNCIEEY